MRTVSVDSRDLVPFQTRLEFETTDDTKHKRPFTLTTIEATGHSGQKLYDTEVRNSYRLTP